ncbi:MAG: hypothetical protein U0235_28555 [Polyangiaceae bacterium]
MRVGQWFVRGAVVVGALGVACSEPPTSISVDIASTFSCAELRGVTVTVANVGSPDERTIDTAQCTDGAPEARIGRVVVLPGGATDAKVMIRVIGGVARTPAECLLDPALSGCVMARRVLRFAPRREIDLPVVLRRECVGVACDEASTCVAGACRPAQIEDSFACEGTACDEGSLRPPTPIPVGSNDGGPLAPDASAPEDAGPSADAAVDAADAGPPPLVCGASEKVCDGKCVASADPAFGCGKTGCSACPDLATGDYACASDRCALLKCKTGFKRCGDACVPVDPAHGCDAASCAACDATNGTPTCSGAAGTTSCALTCKSGFKLCGGRCVAVSDPTYGCTATGCSAAGCPSPSGGTLTCSGTTCVIGSCPAGTKNCNQKCVPTDAQNGCSDTARCTACPTGNICSGTPAVCTCVADPVKTTCAGKSCGKATNNCGQQIDCPNKCQAPDVCGGGTADANHCGCTAFDACGGRNCDYAQNNCGQWQYCGSCSYPELCGGGTCGLQPDGDCGSGWATMGTFTCDDQHAQHQTICGCHPPLYYDPTIWAFDGGSCYTHYTGQSC